jgi:hypothetical protein
LFDAASVTLTIAHTAQTTTINGVEVPRAEPASPIAGSNPVQFARVRQARRAGRRAAAAWRRLAGDGHTHGR